MRTLKTKNKGKVAGKPRSVRIRGVEAVSSPIKKEVVGVQGAGINLRVSYLEVFELLGGVEEFARWAALNNRNQSEFYRQISKMLPREVLVRDDDVKPNDLTNLTESELDAIIADSLKSR